MEKLDLNNNLINVFPIKFSLIMLQCSTISKSSISTLESFYHSWKQQTSGNLSSFKYNRFFFFLNEYETLLS